MNKVIMTNDSTVKILTKFLKTWIWHLKTCVPMTKNLTTRQENMHGVVELDCSPTLMISLLLPTFPKVCCRDSMFQQTNEGPIQAQ
jgi:hypothetical protein